jgi:hypothetical protein
MRWCVPAGSSSLIASPPATVLANRVKSASAISRYDRDRRWANAAIARPAMISEAPPARTSTLGNARVPKDTASWPIPRWSV